MEKIIFDLNNKELVSENESIFALGKFRSLHKGHQKIINKAMIIARKENKKFGIMIFDDNDSVFPLEIREELISQYKPDYILLFEENINNFKTTQEEFLEYMKEKFNTSKYVVGKNFSFGKGNYDDFEKIRNFAELEVMELEKINNQIISSTLIKLLLDEGKIPEIKNLLDFNYIYKGEVLNGIQRGREMGFPTVNLRFPENIHKPKNGIYSSFITIDKKRYKSITSISTNPTFEDKEIKYETYIFDFNEFIYGKNVYVELINFIRNPIKFENTEKLIEKIREDINIAKNHLK